MILTLTRMLICCLQAGKMCHLRITAERSLRPEKTKMKVSGQFDNLNRASDHAIIRSYIETGKRYGWNIFELCTRALEGHYLTLEEMQQKHAMEK